MPNRTTEVRFQCFRSRVTCSRSCPSAGCSELRLELPRSCSFAGPPAALVQLLYAAPLYSPLRRCDSQTPLLVTLVQCLRPVRSGEICPLSTSSSFVAAHWQDASFWSTQSPLTQKRSSETSFSASFELTHVVSSFLSKYFSICEGLMPHVKYCI